MSEEDPYLNPDPAVPGGENLLTIGADGSFSVTRPVPEDRPKRLKPSARKAIEESGDDVIVEYPERETGYTYYRIGSVGVKYRGRDRWLCLTCSYPSNYQDEEHRGCSHITRVERFRAEHLEELNYAKADPATEVPIA